ncbi:MAG: FtsW/RodA/SpoVE family cell cycle protein [Oscillospiraceae bacterium]|nr:FtsW/RodA/SpoVE family cell cycle protein [Oscillospiraceae bacterium]
MSQFVQIFTNAADTYLHVYIGIMRYLAPVLACILLLRCVKPLLTFRRQPEIWAWLCLEDGKKLPLTHWENVIGRSKRSDIVIDLPAVSKSHAVLTRYDDGSWTVTDAGSTSGVRVNGKQVDISALQPEDKIEIGGIRMTLTPISHRQEKRLAELRGADSGLFRNLVNVVLLSVFQLLCCVAFLLGSDSKTAASILGGFGGIFICQWVLFVFYMVIRRTSFEVETVAFFLCTMGMAAIAAVKPGEVAKQLVALLLGLGVFLLVGWSLRDLERAKKFRYLAAAAGLGFLVITLLFGKEYYGAKNWLVLGPLSIQPSELSKVCFVYAGASTMDRIVNKRNLFLFIAYSAAVCSCLALMNDFGTALIFFTAFLVIAFLRSGSVGTVTLACASLGFAGVVALKIAPHALRRFSAWRHVWENPLTTGYQQTRSLMCIASGGLLGLGAGQGWMKNMFAADSDVVFATLSEEWGILMAIMLVLSILALGLFAMRSAAVGRSSFYTIGACTAAGILLVQTILNVLGTVDVLPLTGVTFPFVSNGGSSMICSWGLLAFVKAADTRQNASFAVPLGKKRRDEDE